MDRCGQDSASSAVTLARRASGSGPAAMTSRLAEGSTRTPTPKTEGRSPIRPPWSRMTQPPKNWFGTARNIWRRKKLWSWI